MAAGALLFADLAFAAGAEDENENFRNSTFFIIEREFVQWCSMRLSYNGLDKADLVDTIFVQRPRSV